jgi:hypothetical protein
MRRSIGRLPTTEDARQGDESFPALIFEFQFHGLSKWRKAVFGPCGRPKTRFETCLRCSLRLNVPYCPVHELTPQISLRALQHRLEE